MNGTFKTSRSNQMNTDQWVPILRPYWERGMTSWKEAQLISEAAAASGLTIDRVKMWISNYRKKLSRSQKDARPKEEPKPVKMQEYDVYTTYGQQPEEYSMVSPNFEMESPQPINTDQWLPILKPFWDRGMTSWRDTHLIAEAVHATGGQLDVERVKTWIANYRKKLARPKKDGTVKEEKRLITGFDMFCRAYMPVQDGQQAELQIHDHSGNMVTTVSAMNMDGSITGAVGAMPATITTTTVDLNAGWSSLSDAERAHYQQQADIENQANQVTPEMTAERLRRKSMRIIQREMLKLQQLGCKGGMFLCVSPDSKKIMYSSDLEARNVFVAKESTDFRNMYLHTFKEGASASELQQQVALSKRSFLRRSVQRLFKRKYGECSGYVGAFPYSFFRKGLCYATGMPQNIPIRTVGEYSVSQLQAILDNSSDIQFHKSDSLGSNTTTIDKTALPQQQSYLSQTVTSSIYPAPQGCKTEKSNDQQSQQQQPQVAFSKRSYLRRAVKQLFTQKYLECSGVEGAFPYSFFREGVYYATGMPMELSVKTVGEYSVTQLQAILDAAPYIVFHKSDNQPQSASGSSAVVTQTASSAAQVQQQTQQSAAIASSSAVPVQIAISLPTVGGTHVQSTSDAVVPVAVHAIGVPASSNVGVSVSEVVGGGGSVAGVVTTTTQLDKVVVTSPDMSQHITHAHHAQQPHTHHTQAQQQAQQPPTYLTQSIDPALFPMSSAVPQAQNGLIDVGEPS